MAENFALPASLHEQTIKEMERALTVRGLPFDFCKDWPTIKAFLEALKNIPILALVVGILLSIGEAYYTSHCKK
jgi:hypothetical protein